MSRSNRWRALRLGAAALVVAALVGCAAPRTTVVLLPDEGGHVGAVMVSGAGATQRVDRAYDEVVVERGRLAAPVARGKPAIDDAYVDLLKAQPTMPRTFVVNFLVNTTTMTDASRARLPEILDAVRARRPTEITVYGHADATGGEAHNDRLSAERARVVAELLRKADPTLEIELQACGDRMPLPGSEGHGPEARNRRAEVVIL